MAYFAEKFAHFGSVLLPQLFLIFHILISAHAIPHSSRSLTSIESSQNGGDRETARGLAVTDGARADRFTGTPPLRRTQQEMGELQPQLRASLMETGINPAGLGRRGRGRVPLFLIKVSVWKQLLFGHSIRQLHKIFLGETFPVSKFPKGDAAITVFPLKCDFITVGRHLRTRHVSQNWPTLETFRESP